MMKGSKNRKETAKRPKVVRWLVLIAVLWVAIGLVWWMRRPATLDREAGRFLDAMLTSDGNAMLAYAFPEEVQANKLTPEKLHRLYAELINPRLNKLENKSEITTQNRRTNGFAGFDAQTLTGREVGVGTSVYLHDAGAKGSVFENLYIAWIAEYLGEHSETMNLQVRNQAVLNGLLQDEAKLKEIGITHLSSYNIDRGDIKLIPLEEMISGYRRWVANRDLEH
jgi:hypothetical protein